VDTDTVTTNLPPKRPRSRRGGARFVSSRIGTLPSGTYTDPAQPGLQLRVRTTKRHIIGSWLHRFKFRGCETRVLIGHFPETTLEAARRIVREQREQLSQGMDPRRGAPRRRTAYGARTLSAAAAGADHTVDFLVTEFIERYLRPNRKRPQHAEHILRKNVLAEWHYRDARSIKPREVILLLDGIVSRGCSVLANRTASLLGQLFKFGVHRGIVDSSPVQLLMAPGGKEKPRQRVLSDQELAAFLSDPKACTRFARLAHVITLLLLTGQRRGELAAAEWKHVDFNAATWFIPAENAKTARDTLVPLAPWALQEFGSLRQYARKSRWVLPTVGRATAGGRHIHPQQLTTSLVRCMPRFRRVGIQKFTLHDLRRTCRTGLARLGIEPHIAERVLGHTQGRIAATYDVHNYAVEKRRALESWATHLAGLKPAVGPPKG